MTHVPVLLRLKQLHVGAVLPHYATPGAACFDLHAVIEEGSIIIMPKERKQVRTGIAAEVPSGYVLQLFSRSGHGAKFGVRLGNCVGIIDSDYRGELFMIVTNDGDAPFRLKHGERCMQGMVMPLPTTRLAFVEQLSATARGAGGLGSTGA